MKTVIIVMSSVLISGMFACSSPPEEKQAATTQYIESTGGTCAHALCVTGVALSSTCDPCSASLCAQDPYCCSTTWDATCVGEVGSICGQSCNSLAAPPVDASASVCEHPVCSTGGALASSCEPCATQLCALDPYCCSVTWDATCVGEVSSICGKSCN